MTLSQSRFITVVCLLLATLAVAGCSESPQEKYNDAISNLHDAKNERQQAKEKVADAREQVQDAQKKLNQAQEQLQQAQQEVNSAMQAVNKTVNDEVLFRTLQKKLLNSDKFSESAISVGVNHRVVTLTGTVPDQQTRKQAAQVVRNSAGVASVNNQLQVTNGNNDASNSGGDQNANNGNSSGNGG
ncbi:BON domain-containing protein [Salinisphaera sp.]|uniref:BON domain-containing protein n=1 Tax=Salinisphaera sp. TaxID=1914330 RepID=UPI002D77F896|nr:BON domain-containing protein [Salinisphaera sp.]HET7313341.1 BON domain-containing protein [Salinisphaera sp.]